MAKKPRPRYTMRSPRIRVGRRAGARSSTLAVLTVGPKRSFYSRVLPPRGVGGKFRPLGVGESMRPIVPEAARWPSVGRYADLVRSNGLDQWTRDLVKFMGSVKNASAPAMARSLVPTMTLSRYYCPKDTTVLVKSAYLDVVKDSAGEARVEFGYARTGRPFYAAFVHEIAKYHHDAPTSYKFLTRALKEDWGRIRARYTEEMRKVVRP